jgi:hypothetical protein
MVNAPDGYQFHFDPASYLETIRRIIAGVSGHAP